MAAHLDKDSLSLRFSKVLEHAVAGTNLDFVASSVNRDWLVEHIPEEEAAKKIW